MSGALVWEDDKRVYGDAGYTGMWKHLDEEKMPRTPGAVLLLSWRSQENAKQPHEKAATGDQEGQVQHPSQGRHPFHVIKNLLATEEVRFKGLAENKAQLFILYALGNLVLAGRCLAHVDWASLS
ncbi:hypothetical protein [Halomonas rhizosphaerae]|uniref:hypothetical protein n=1 Tax=Halomonas rhizosphaerae TaxID=3043296 RepID=UPI00389944A9